MAEAQGSAPKTCTVCGTNVSGKPRVKDAQGRYMCKACFDKARATKGAQEHAAKPKPEAAAKPVPLADEDNSFLLGIGSSSIASEGTAPCPECGRALTKNTIVCVGCGFNTQTGKRMQVKVTKERAPKGESAASGESMLKNPHVLGLLTLCALGGLALLALVDPSLSAAYFVLLAVFSLVVHIWVVFAAWQDETIHGVLCLVTFFFGIFWFYMLYWTLIRNENTLLKWMFINCILGPMIGFGILAATGNLNL